ncbi:UpxY family transcription antiterminator [Puia dinghuensis]|uniref:NusG-like N-terminal domain-containing protein n=1 Tax=Puia dinghuensis TaxID=1792502 RepID=A0A8J2UJ23_9BACT|nr:UpxY family transcription antiterminator [Puia dinghuensis]GGB24136.1 hypothetical protein GCM10011511_55070 [Puia dinghuensis]
MIKEPISAGGRTIDATPEVKKWYVAYTLPKSEEKAQNQLEKIGIHCYLPMHRVIRNWSDRKKKLLVPLFPNYIFVNIADKKRNETFTVKEIVRYVSFGGKPAVINESIINSLQHILDKTMDIDIEKYVQPGVYVRITHGPFAGSEGVLMRRNGNTRLLVQIDALQQGIAVNISIDDISPLNIEKISP